MADGTGIGQRGSIMVMALMISVLAVVLGLAFASSISSQNAVFARDRAKGEAIALNNLLRLLYGNEARCSANLITGSVAGEITRLLLDPTQTPARNLQINYPAFAANPVIPLLQTGIGFQSLRIDGVGVEAIGNFSPNRAAGGSFGALVTFTIPLSFGNGLTGRPLRFPTYIVADSASRPTACSLTGFADNGQTVEDAICERLVATGTYYDMSSRMCVTPPGGAPP